MYNSRIIWQNLTNLPCCLCCIYWLSDDKLIPIYWFFMPFSPCRFQASCYEWDAQQSSLPKDIIIMCILPFSWCFSYNYGFCWSNLNCTNHSFDFTASDGFVVVKHYYYILIYYACMLSMTSMYQAMMNVKHKTT